jgi:hypothetical protein
MTPEFALQDHVFRTGQAAPRTLHHHRVDVRGRPWFPLHAIHIDCSRPALSRRGDPVGILRMAPAHGRASSRRGACERRVGNNAVIASPQNGDWRGPGPNFSLSGAEKNSRRRNPSEPRANLPDQARRGVSPARGRGERVHLRWGLPSVGPKAPLRPYRRQPRLASASRAR